MRILFLLIGMALPWGLCAQVLSGTVTDADGLPLAGASVYMAGTTTGANADETGAFEFLLPKADAVIIVASFVGYVSDTLTVGMRDDRFLEIKLAADDRLGVVEVRSVREGVRISNYHAIKTETITETELKKAACCDLAGCFDTQTTVQPQVTNVITNATELRIMGLSGVYNQVLIDGLPMIQGLTYTYGISSVPGTSVQNISVAKGANSVVQGFESISGQINVETKSPHTTDKLLLNAYMNSFGERHFNANYTFGKGRWNNLTTLHVVRPAGRIDRDGDDLMDLPLLSRMLVTNKWQYGKESEWGWSSTVGFRYLDEERIGGQVNFDPDVHQGGTEVYGQSVKIAQPEVWTRTAYRFNDRARLALFASAFVQRQRSAFGTVMYDARQANAYVNLQYERNYGSRHSLKTGMSFRHLDLEEDINFTGAVLGRTYDGVYRRREYIPGAFAENTMSFLDGRLTWMAGVRGDNHNVFGFRLTPRTLLKYNVSDDAAFRASAGTGWRTVNLFSENIGLLAGSRNVIFSEELRPEQAANYGINFTQNYDLGEVSGFISLDYYHTAFSNQIFPDFDSNPAEAIVGNFTGRSTANTFQSEFLVRFMRRFEVKAGYNFLDVFRRIDGEKEVLPFNPKHKVLTTLNYRPLSEKFQCDVNVHWFGQQRLPSTDLNPEAFQRPDLSETFTLINAQFTWFAGAFELYGGCENIFDFRQLRPVLGWQDPFGPHFDTAFVWGPTRGREFYIGVRYRIP